MRYERPVGTVEKVLVPGWLARVWRLMEVAEVAAADVLPEEEIVEVTSNVSPIYNDAMQYALQGHDAATISQNYGISRAEAELVVALVRNRES